MHQVIIEAGKSSKQYWKEIFQSIGLIWILAQRDLSVRFKQTVLGLLWSVVRPLSTMIVFVFLFNKIARMQVEPELVKAPALVVYAGVLMWVFYSSALQQVSLSIVNNSNMITKVYFPRLIMPFSSISVPLVDFLIGLVLFIPLYWQYHFVPSWQVFFAPLFLILAIVSAFGLGLIFAVFNVQYRDFGQIIPFLVQFGFFACPVAFSTYAIQNESWYQYYNYIPVVGIIDGFRWSMLGGAAELKWQSLIPAIVFALIVNVIAVYLFRKKENTFVDYI